MPDGLLLRVDDRPLQTNATADVDAGQNVIPVEWPGRLPDAGGTIRVLEVAYPYLSIDESAGTVTLATPLTVAVVAGDPIQLELGGAPAIARDADVLLDGADEPITVDVPHGLLALVPVGDETDVYAIPWPVTIDPAYSQLVNVESRPAVLQLAGAVVDDDGTTLDEALEAASQSGGSSDPTTAPTSTPTPEVYADASTGTLRVSWDVSEDFRTRLRLFAAPQPADGTTPPADESTLFAEGVAPPCTVGTVQGVAPVPGSPYLIALQAYYLNADGTVLDGPVSDWVLGTPEPVSPLILAVKILTDLLQAATVNALTLTGARIIAQELVTQGVLRIYGGADSTLSGTLIASLGVTTPTAPTVTLDWPQLAIGGGNTASRAMRGLCDDGDRWLTIKRGVDTTSDDVLTVYAIDKTSGAVTTFHTDQYSDYGARKIGMGITRIGSTYFMAYSQDDGAGGVVYRCRPYTFTNGAFTPSAPSFGIGYSTWASDVALASNPAGQLVVVGMNSNIAGGGYQLTADRYSTAGVIQQSSGLLPAQATALAVSGAAVTSADYGSDRYFVTFGGVLRIVTVDGLTNTTAADSWAYPADGTLSGIAWANGAFSTLGASYVTSYTGNRAGATDYAITWRDDDAGGTGTAETKPSPRRTVTVNRQRVNVTLPSGPPDDGSADGANTATIYAASVPNTTLRAQTDLSEVDAKSGAAVRYLTAPATTGRAAPTSSGFEGRPGGIGRYQSAATDAKGAKAQLNGDGSYRFAGANLDDVAPAAITLTSSATPSGPAPTIAKVGGRSQIVGSISAVSWTANTVYTVGQLPAGTYPAAAINRPCSANRVAVNVNVIITVAGVVQVQTGATAPSAVDLSGISGYLCAT